MAELTLFFATDIHGSETCWRKFLNAAKVYKADVMVLGGDMTGKVIVPIYTTQNGWQATWKEQDYNINTKAELDELVPAIRGPGAYPYVTTREEIDAVVGDAEAEHALFTKLKMDVLRGWMALADERLAGTGVRCFVMAGNDDPYEIDEALGSARTVVNTDRLIVQLTDRIAMLSFGASTVTPWHSPRELSEDEYLRQVEPLVGQLAAPERAIFNFHDPPYNSDIDVAPQIDDLLRVQYRATGEPIYAPVGSRSVRALVEKYQPMLGLHGHVHEGRGRYKMGRTVGFNPGSDYTEGMLRGVLIKLSDHKGVREYSFTMG
jgi:Icc-related predicted phosphoesterase